MAASGAKVLQLRSVEYARTHGVRIHCRSSFDEPRYLCPRRRRDDGTPPDHRRHALDRGSPDHAARRARPPRRRRRDLRRARRRRLQRRHDHPERAARGGPQTPRCSFTIANEDLSRRRGGARTRGHATSASSGSTPTSEIGKVSIVGAGMRSHPGVAAKVFETLADEGINIEMISTSPIKISCVIRSDAVPQAVQALHRRSTSAPAGSSPSGRSERRRDDLRVAVVGATGVVGTTMLSLLRERAVPGRARSSRSPPSAPPAARSTAVPVRVLDDGEIERLRHRAVLGRAPARSREWAPRFVEAGAIVVDNSSAFRRDPEIPLVVSEVNPHALERHRGLIANPNCSTMQLLVALAPIHARSGLERIVVATYQSMSGTGQGRGRRARGPGARLAARRARRRRRASIPSRSRST